MIKYILVTGGLGYIGSHVCVELLNNDYQIIVIDNLSNSKLEIVDRIQMITNKSFIFINGDLLEIQSIEKIFNQYQIDLVIHLAGCKSIQESTIDPIKYYMNNVICSINLINTMKKFNCKKFLFSSSATVYGNQQSPVNELMETGRNIINPYGKTKYVIEEMLKDIYQSDQSWSIIILRYFNPIGAHHTGLIGENPNQPNNLFPYLLKVSEGHYPYVSIYGNDYDTPDGTCVRDYIHVVDLSKGHIKVIQKLQSENLFDIYNLGTGKSTSVMQLITEMEKVNNISINYQIVGRKIGDIPIIYANIDKAKEKLQYETEKSIKEMCEDGYRFVITQKLSST